jgi:hypothetical protein
MRPISQQLQRLEMSVQQWIFGCADVDDDQSPVGFENPARFPECAPDIIPMMGTVPCDYPAKGSVLEGKFVYLTSLNRKVAVLSLSSFTIHDLNHLGRQVVCDDSFSEGSGREAKMSCATTQIQDPSQRLLL